MPQLHSRCQHTNIATDPKFPQYSSSHHPRSLLTRRSLEFSLLHSSYFFFFFFNDTATTEIYTLSLHDALPIYDRVTAQAVSPTIEMRREIAQLMSFLLFAFLTSAKICVISASVGTPSFATAAQIDRKSTRLNSSH